MTDDYFLYKKGVFSYYPRERYTPADVTGLFKENGKYYVQGDIRGYRGVTQQVTKKHADYISRDTGKPIANQQYVHVSHDALVIRPDMEFREAFDPFIQSMNKMMLAKNKAAKLAGKPLPWIIPAKKTAKKPAVKKSTAKKTTEKKPVARKSPAKKAAAKKPAARKTAVKKRVARKA